MKRIPQYGDIVRFVDEVKTVSGTITKPDVVVPVFDLHPDIAPPPLPRYAYQQIDLDDWGTVIAPYSPEQTPGTWHYPEDDQ